MATTSIRVLVSTKEKLKKLQRPGQSLAGVIEELVQFYESARSQPGAPQIGRGPELPG